MADIGVPPKYGCNGPAICRPAKMGLEGLDDGCPIKDVPANLFKLLPRLIAAGAEHVSGRELVKRLIASGLRITARERREG